MKKLFSKFFALALVGVLALVLAACGTTEETNRVRVGIHANEGGATLFAVAHEMGYFKAEGLDVQVTVVESGPAEMTAMRADNRSLDIGYIGAGVAWNPIDDSGNKLQFVYLDTLSISEALIANPSKKPGIDKESTWAEIYQALKGSKIGIPTDTTPGSWFKNFIAKVNENAGEGGVELPDTQKLWIYSETSAYLTDYVAPNTNSVNKIEVVTESNENLPMAFSAYDFVCGFAPATLSIISEHAENIEKSLRWAETLTQANEGTYKAEAMIAPSANELYDWFSDFNGLGYEYMRALYNSKVGNVPEGNRVRTLPEAMSLGYMLKALAAVVEK
jgi:hypothetical protein